MIPPETRRLARGAVSIAYRVAGEPDAPPVVLLHATLSSAAQLRGLAERLGTRFRVLAVDRRGSGETAAADPAPPTPIDVGVHVDDLAAILAAEEVDRAIVAGHSYGGCLALEFAARRPDLVRAIWAWEPPYGPVAPADLRERLARVGRETVAAGRDHGPAAAAEVFLAAVAGVGAVVSLPPPALERVRRAGAAAIADATLLGLEPARLAGIGAPVVLAHGDRDSADYRVIAEALAGRIPGAVLEPLGGVGHTAPITDPELVAASIERLAARLGPTRNPDPSAGAPAATPPVPAGRATQEPRS
jgi:pimeloyl-ACP methyl ester carboxylesterase